MTRSDALREALADLLAHHDRQNATSDGSPNDCEQGRRARAALAAAEPRECECGCGYPNNGPAAAQPGPSEPGLRDIAARIWRDHYLGGNETHDFGPIDETDRYDADAVIAELARNGIVLAREWDSIEELDDGRVIVQRRPSSLTTADPNAQLSPTDGLHNSKTSAE